MTKEDQAPASALQGGGRPEPQCAVVVVCLERGMTKKTHEVAEPSTKWPPCLRCGALAYAPRAFCECCERRMCAEAGIEWRPPARPIAPHQSVTTSTAQCKACGSLDVLRNRCKACGAIHDRHQLLFKCPSCAVHAVPRAAEKTCCSACGAQHKVTLIEIDSPLVYRVEPEETASKVKLDSSHSSRSRATRSTARRPRRSSR